MKKLEDVYIMNKNKYIENILKFFFKKNFLK